MTTRALHVRTYRTGALGLPVVLLHGFPFDSRMWDDVGPLLTGAGPVLAVDLPGLGESSDPSSSEASLDIAADQVAAALGDLGIRRAVVAGLSMGGYVALALLDRHPGLVAGLGLLDTKSTVDDPGARANRLRLADEVEDSGTVAAVRPMAAAVLGETSRAAQSDLERRLEALIDEQPPAGVAWSQRAMAARPDRTEVLTRFAGPALVLVGDEDRVTPRATAEHMASSLSDVRLVVVPRAGHLSAIENPGAVADAVAELVRRADLRETGARPT